MPLNHWMECVILWMLLVAAIDTAPTQTKQEKVEGKIGTLLIKLVTMANYVYIV